MYHDYFGFQRRPFDGGISRDADVFLGARQQAAVENLRVSFTTFDSIATLIGPPGVGKTTLTCSAVRAASTRLALGWLCTTPLNVQELLEMLLAEFGLDAQRAGRVERLQLWRQFLNEMSATASRVFVVVEHAHELGPDLLRGLESLTAADASSCPGANVVLMGSPALADTLAVPALAPLKQRVRLRQRIDPLDAQESEAYLAHRVTTAGGDFAALFPPGAVALLHHFAAGVPRVLNNLCETALSVAASRQEQRIEPERVTQVAVELFGMEMPNDAPNARPLSTATTDAESSPAGRTEAVDATSGTEKRTEMADARSVPRTSAQKPDAAPRAAQSAPESGRRVEVDFPVLTDAVEDHPDTPAPSESSREQSLSDPRRTDPLYEDDDDFDLLAEALTELSLADHPGHPFSLDEAATVVSRMAEQSELDEEDDPITVSAPHG